MKIEFYTTGHREAWDRYVFGHPDGTVFHLSTWQKVVEKAFNHKSHHLMAINDQSGQIEGLLPLVEIKSSIFDHFLTSIPFAELGGILADNSNVEMALLERAIELSKKTKVAYLELKNKSPQPGLATKSLYFNFSRNIFETEEKNLLAIPRKSRAMVRKGINAGLSGEWGKHFLDEFYFILAKNYHRLGTPIFPKRLFRILLDEFGESANLLIIRNSLGTSIAAVMTFFYQDRVMPYYAGSLAEYRHLAPNDFMYWTLMNYGMMKGFKTFDFGRSKAETGSFSFKKNWGFEPTPLCYQYYVSKGNSLPNLSPSNPQYARKIRLWRKLPFALTKLIGPQIAKYLA